MHIYESDLLKTIKVNSSSKKTFDGEMNDVRGFRRT